MRYRLDPGLPVTLCSSTQLRIGDSDARLTLPDTPLVRTLIELAQLGTTRAELLTDAQKWALQRRQPTDQLAELVDLLLGVCEPIALRDPTNRQLLIRTTAASRPLAELIAGSVNLQGHRVAIGDEHTNPADLDPLPDVVVDIAERMLAPRRYLHMASLQIPQLAIVRETARDLIGPLSLPPVTPCPNCDELHRVASELGWFAVATQLAASPPPTDSDTRRWCTALVAAEHLCDLLAQPVTEQRVAAHPLANQTLMLSPRFQSVRQRQNCHDECGCQAQLQTDSWSMTPPDGSSARSSAAIAGGLELAPHTAVDAPHPAAAVS